jgi:hypothetical protein
VQFIAALFFAASLLVSKFFVAARPVQFWLSARPQVARKGEFSFDRRAARSDKVKAVIGLSDHGADPTPARPSGNAL